MTPKKGKDLIIEHAKREGIPEQDMMDMVCGFYDEIKACMGEFKHHNILIQGLGNMVLKTNKSKKDIEELKREIANPHLLYNKRNKQQKVDMLQKALESQQKEYDRKANIRAERSIIKARKKNESEREDTDSMEEQDPDFGRWL